MSAICGLINLHGLAINPNILRSFNHCLKDYGGDGEHIWVQANVGLGQQTLHLTLESIRERLPYYNESIKLAIAGDIRLFNRKELCAKLNLADTINLSDSQIILSSYIKYDKACAEHLLGEYSIVIWDNRKQELICITDHFSHNSIYYYQDDAIFAFASSIDALNSLAPIKRSLNLKKIALFNHSAIDEVKGETYFSNIKYIPAAGIMTIHANGSNTLKYYWQPELPPLRRFKSEDEFAEAFQEVFSQVISGATRTHLPICSLFSGGLDSSAITAMAAHVLAKQQRNLISLSAVLAADYVGNERDESYYINLLQAQNLTKLSVTDVKRGPFDNLNDFSSAPSASSRHYLYRAFNDAARANGAKIILDGCYGEVGPTYWNDEYLGELCKRFKYGKLIYNIRQHKKLFERSLRSIMFHDILRPNLPRSWQNKLQTRRDLDYITRFGLIKPEFIARYISQEQLDANAQQLINIGAKSGTDGRYNNFIALQSLFEQKTPASGALNEAGKSRVRYSYPYLDKRLLDFCLSVPNELRYKNGYRRYIVRRGMQGIMPDELCYRTTKEPFSPDYHNRYKNQLPLARQALAVFKNNPLVNQVLDLQRLEEYFSLEMGSNRCATKNDFIGMHSLPHAMYLASFLVNNS